MATARCTRWTLLLVAALYLTGCGADDGGPVSATPTPLLGTGRTATPTPLGAAGVRLALSNGASVALDAVVSGTRVSGPSDARATSYGPTTQSVAARGAAVVEVPGLAPGVWLHRVAVAATGQQQYRQALVVDDPASSNAQAWTLFASVLSVNQSADTGDGTCDQTCTMRDAAATANTLKRPVLIVFDHAALGTPAQVESVDRRIIFDSPGVTVDGTDEQGDPSPVVDFAQRTFPVRITLRGTKHATAEVLQRSSGKACPCSQNYGGTLFSTARGVAFVGLHVDRIYPPQKEICCGDQTLIEMGKGAPNTRVDTCLLDGGGRAITDAVTPKGNTGQATSKDCVKPEHTGSTAAQPVVVSNSELSYCLDRGVKVQNDFLLLSHNWIHNNLRCALFATVPQGSIDAIGNVIEENGKNCPSGAPPFCDHQETTRPDAPQVSAQGTGTQFALDGNVVRDGPFTGVFWQVGSTGTLENTFVCGMPITGVLSERQVGQASGALMRGSASVLNGRSGVEARNNVGIDMGSDSGAGHNAFAGNPARAQVVNSLQVADALEAQGDQWQSCYPAQGANANQCDVDTISVEDAGNPQGNFSAVDVRNPEPQQSNGAVTLTSADPTRVAEGQLLGLTGSGFDAITGLDGLTPDDCAKLATTNTCTPLHGTCVEFQLDGAWTPAADVLAVTPTFVMVRAPFTCTAPVQARVRRAVLSGSEAVSNELTICRN